MPKIPKFSELTDVSGILNKMKSAFDNLAGVGGSSATQEALTKESDPVKAKFLEVELLISQLHDLTVLQNKTVSELASKYAEIKAISMKHLPESQPAEDKSDIAAEPLPSKSEEAKKPENNDD